MLLLAHFFVASFASSRELSFMQTKQLGVGLLRYSNTSSVLPSKNGRRTSLSVSTVIPLFALSKLLHNLLHHNAFFLLQKIFQKTFHFFFNFLKPFLKVKCFFFSSFAFLYLRVICFNLFAHTRTCEWNHQQPGELHNTLVHSPHCGQMSSWWFSYNRVSFPLTWHLARAKQNQTSKTAILLLENST